MKNLNFSLAEGDRNGDRNEILNLEAGLAEKIFALVKDNPKITIVMIAEKTGLTKRQAERCVMKLKKSGHLVRGGSTKGGRWIVIDE